MSQEQGMFRIALPFLAGILSLNLFSELPGGIVYLAFAVAITTWYLNRSSSFATFYGSIAICVCGICWAQIHASVYFIPYPLQKHKTRSDPFGGLV